MYQLKELKRRIEGQSLPQAPIFGTGGELHTWFLKDSDPFGVFQWSTFSSNTGLYRAISSNSYRAGIVDERGIKIAVQGGIEFYFGRNITHSPHSSQAAIGSPHLTIKRDNALGTRTLGELVRTTEVYYWDEEKCCLTPRVSQDYPVLGEVSDWASSAWNDLGSQFLLNESLNQPDPQIDAFLARVSV